MFAYSIKGKLKFHFERDPHLPQLLKGLNYCQIAAPDAESVALVCHGFHSELKGVKWNFYKGIPWRAQVTADQDHIQRIVFQAPFFRTFLFVRQVLLPLLWRQAVQHGGFYLIGSAYRDAHATTIIFAHPGAGKTRYLLNQIEHHHVKFLGDDSLIYLPGEGVFPIFRKIELRLNTIRHSFFWSRLSRLNRFHLYRCELISRLTRRFISFNEVVDPEQLGIAVDTDCPEQPHHLMQLSPDGTLNSLTTNNVSDHIINYLENFHQYFPNIFPTEPPLAQTQKCLRIFSEKYLSK